MDYEREHWDKLSGDDLRGAEWVPIEYLKPFREWARRPGEPEGADPEYYERLKNHIATKGFRSPLWLEFATDDHSGYLGEGNHRLSIAEDLGHTHVPVKVNRRHKSYSDVRVPMDLQAHMLDTDRFGKPYIPQYLTPSQVGLPGSPEPPQKTAAIETEPDWGDLDEYFRNPDDIQPWTKGGHGKFLITPDGEFISWSTNALGEPHHDAAADELGVGQILKGEIAPSGAWWISDIIDPSADPDEWIERVAPQARDQGLRPPFAGYLARTAFKSDICDKCLNHYQDCTCAPDGLTIPDDPAADPVRDLKSPVAF